MKIVLDTNILLEDASNLFNFGDATIVIPEIVLDEIDSKKSGVTELAWQAREFARILQKAKRVSTSKESYGFCSTLLAESTTIEVVSLADYNIPVGFDPKNINDYKIIATTMALGAKLITNDVNCGLKAEALGLEVEPLRYVERTEFDYIKNLEVPTEVFPNIDNALVTDIDPGYKHENFNYMFTCPDSNQTKLAYVDPTFKLKVMGKAVDKDLQRQALPPLNAGQKFFSRAILDPINDLIICEAFAGSGKTAQALSSAMKLVGTNSPYEGIIYIRASVSDLEKEEEVGYLPGLEEKFAPYLHPLTDSLEAIAKKSNSNSKLSGAELDEKIQTDIQNYIKKYHIQSMITLGMRGRTFSNAVIIIDEAQNMSKSSLQKVLTRFGKNCKVIIVGSNRQIDHPYINKYNNGLSVMLNECAKPSDLITVNACTLSRVVRSPLAEYAERIFSK